MKGDPPKPVIFASVADFRAWLAKNHATATEVWVGYYKKDSGKKSMTYAEAVDEALCWGWIDGLTKSFGDYYANRWTPRRKDSIWSAINIAKMAALEKAGRLKPAGRKVFEERDRRKDQPYSYEVRADLPAWALARLRENAGAWQHWQAETPSYRRGVARWLLDAKREETRERRLADLIADSAAGRRVKPFRAFDTDRKR